MIYEDLGFITWQGHRWILGRNDCPELPGFQWLSGEKFSLIYCLVSNVFFTTTDDVTNLTIFIFVVITLSFYVNMV